MTHELQSVLAPRSVAVIGASSDPTKRGYQAIRQLLDDGFSGPIYPINPRAPEILGLQAYGSVREIEGPVDLVLICTPAHSLPGLLADCGAKGIGGAVVLAAGFDEALAEETLVAANTHKVRVIGPNTNGIFNLHANMNLVGVKNVKAGPVSITSQSGNMMLAVTTEIQRRDGVGFSTYVGVGNQLDVRLNEYLEYFGQDDDTKVPLFYIEGFKNGRRFLEVCREVTQKKPVVIYKSGRTTAGQASAASHTGSLASAFNLTRDLLHQAGATVIEQSDKMLSVAEGLAQLPIAGGGRVAILADGGGHATITTDALIEQGAALATLTDMTIAALREVLPPAASSSNPVDVAGGTDDDPTVFAECARILLEDVGVDILMICGMFGGYAVRFAESLKETEMETSVKIGAMIRRFGKPIVVQSVYGAVRPEPLEALKAAGVPLFIWPEAAVRTVIELIRYAHARDRNATSPRVEPRPPADAAVAIVGGVQTANRCALFEYEAKDLLKAYGVETPRHFVARSADDMAEAVAVLGEAAMAMKIVSEDILHKSDAGGVKLKVAGEAALRENYQEILTNAYACRADARIDGVLISPMAESGIEVIIGVIHDPTFGPVLMFGLGGILVELLKDVTFRALPLSRADAVEMIDQIQASKILDGVRGTLPVDKPALVDLILKVSTLALAHPEIVEIDLNPVILRHDGYDVVDARMILMPKEH